MVWTQSYDVRVKARAGELQVTVGVPEAAVKATSGLCGIFDENYRNDFTNPDKSISTQPYTFSLNWQISNKSLSLFNPPKSADATTKPEFPPRDNYNSTLWDTIPAIGVLCNVSSLRYCEMYLDLSMVYAACADEYATYKTTYSLVEAQEHCDSTSMCELFSQFLILF